MKITITTNTTNSAVCSIIPLVVPL
jgi:hypothetical protein